MEDGFSGLEGQKNGLLSATFEIPGNSSTRRRSTSVASSIRSARSDITTVDNHSNVPVLDRKAIKRRRTQIAEVKISRWSCFLGFVFGPRIAERAAAATIKGSDMDEDEDIFGSHGFPWIQTIHMLPSDKAGIGHQQARCLLDTGCLQGNLVSEEFARKLGYTESDFRPLRPRESNGGTSATGHTHMPKGALHLTWYHNASPRLYSDMRFLVSPSQQYEIVIGAHSILKYKLVSHPNFAVTAGRTSFKLPSDKDRQNLDQERAKLANELKTLERNLKSERTKGRPNKIKKLEADITKTEKELLVKKLRLQLHDDNECLERDPCNEGLKSKVEDTKNQLREADGGAKKKLAPQDIPPVQVLGPDGNSRTPTGFSIRPRRTRS
ncbi:MAG: hypothetical protein M1840_006090 [Geoglossum simile]|nr:MAG: hypothetical protein M1840_006090 [Geoglossum simile]